MACVSKLWDNDKALCVMYFLIVNSFYIYIQDVI